MAAVPIGVSFGDVVAAIKLISKATKALRSASGATTQYQQTILDLELVETVLSRVQSLSPSTASEETIRVIELCGLACRVPLAHFLQKAKALEPYLDWTPASGKPFLQKIERGGRKLYWTLHLEDDVAKLRTSIGTGLDSINALLQLESLQRGTIAHNDLSKVAKLVEHQLPELDRITDFLQNNSATRGQLDGLSAGLASLTKRVSQLAATEDIKSLQIGFTNLSSTLEETAKADQVDKILPLVQDITSGQRKANATISTLAQSMAQIQRDAEISHAQLALLIQKPPARVMTFEPLTSNNSLADNTGQCSTSTTPSQNLSCQDMRPQQTSDLTHSQIKTLLQTIRQGLLAILIFLLGVNSTVVERALAPLRVVTRSPSALLDDNLTFVDAFGRSHSLQYQQFRYWPVVSSWLKCLFKGCPGELRITHERFALFKDFKATRRATMIPFDEWERTVFPGHRVVMSMYVGLHAPGELGRPARLICPSCEYTRPQCSISSAWSECENCGQSFLRLEASPGRNRYSNTALPLPLPKEPETTNIFDCAEISTFRRIHDMYLRPITTIARYHRLYTGLLRLYDIGALPRRTNMEVVQLMRDTRILRSASVLSVPSVTAKAVFDRPTVALETEGIEAPTIPQARRCLPAPNGVTNGVSHAYTGPRS